MQELINSLLIILDYLEHSKDKKLKEKDFLEIKNIYLICQEILRLLDK